MSVNNGNLVFFSIIACMTFFSVLLAVVISQNGGTEIRRKASMNVIKMNQPIDFSPNGREKNKINPRSIRRQSAPLDVVVNSGHVDTEASTNTSMIAQMNNFVTGDGNRTKHDEDIIPVMNFIPVFSSAVSMDNNQSNNKIGAYYSQNDEDVDTYGRPLRWLSTPSVLFCYTPRPLENASGDNDIGPSPAKTILAARSFKSGLSHYSRLIEEFSSRYNLNSALVLAIVHSESNFSPQLVSSKSAMGLMQLMPSTASGEVHRFLYGKRGSVTYEQLRVPEINIRYGTAYLHILFTRYFSKVADPNAREYCAVAAYNMGPNGFLKLYGRNQEEAIANINSMTADELFASFASKLPLKETRQYVIKVRNAKLRYMALQ